MRGAGVGVASEHVHLIGIGGTGMSSLAGLLQESGCRVTGSDNPLYPPTSLLLEAMGIGVSRYDAANLEPVPDLIVVGNAVSRGNPEAEHVLDRKLPYASMPQVLHARFLRHRHAIVVTGTHGKTTTTAMLAWVLHRAGRDPGFLVGGSPRNFASSHRIGRGAAFVVEGDEYDTAFFDKGPKFMHYRPDTALIGTVEFDHADIYRDLAEVKRVFRWLTNVVPRRGRIVRHEDCEVTREVTFQGDETYRVHERVSALNALGFTVGEIEIVPAGEANRVRMRALVTDRDWHRDQLHGLTDTAMCHRLSGSGAPAVP